MAPTVVFEPEWIVVFYTAWEKVEKACFPVPNDGRFGMPYDDVCLFTSVRRAEAKLVRCSVTRWLFWIQS
jgi:hypothetical protein